MTRFYGGLVYTGGALRKHTHTRTAANTTSMQMQTETDLGGVDPPLPTLVAAHMQSIRCTCKGSMHPCYFRMLASMTATCSHCTTLGQHKTSTVSQNRQTLFINVTFKAGGGGNNNMKSSDKNKDVLCA